MEFSRIKKLKLGITPTPIEFLERLSDALGGPRIYIKRDDYTAAALGGNKVRKLEYLLADARERGADTIITTGGLQSNHARITAGLCASLGLKCVLVLLADEPEDYDGNVLLDALFGSDIIFAGNTDFESEINARLEETEKKYRALGRRTYTIPLGGASPVGCLGYVGCMEEISLQDPGINRVIIAAGSGGTHAGLEAGKRLFMRGARVTGISVLFRKDTIKRQIIAETNGTLELLGFKPDCADVEVYDDYIGPGYAKPDSRTLEAISLLGREGIVLDPVYTGKAMAGLIDLIRKGKFRKSERVLFIHTGGYPGMAVLKKKYRRMLASRDGH
jgi:L-cysteate sulfo-lyase